MKPVHDTNTEPGLPVGSEANGLINLTFEDKVCCFCSSI